MHKMNTEVAKTDPIGAEWANALNNCVFWYRSLPRASLLKSFFAELIHVLQTQMGRKYFRANGGATKSRSLGDFQQTS